MMVLFSGKGMKMKVQKYEIARVIDKLKSIVQKNDQFPALGGILVKDGYLIASNSEITMKVKLEASEGSYFIIPMKAFDLIKNLPDGEIDISATDKNKACGLVCKVEDFKPASNNFRSEFIGKDQSGRKQYRGISFKKTQFGSIEDINYYPLMKEFIEIAGKSELLKTVKDYCREHCAWLKTENDIENHAIDCLLSKAYEYWKDFPKQMPEPDKWIFYFKSIKMLERNL